MIFGIHFLTNQTCLYSCFPLHSKVWSAEQMMLPKMYLLLTSNMSNKTLDLTAESWRNKRDRQEFMWFGPSVDGRDDHYLQHQDHNDPFVYQVFFRILLQEWRLVLVERKVVYTSWIWIGKIWIWHTNHIAGRPTSEEQIWLWHWRLGHLSLSHLHKLFPSLFSMVQVSNFQYDSCVSQTSSNFVFFKIKKKLQCLSQLFINVWGPSCVINYLSLKWFLFFYWWLDSCFKDLSVEREKLCLFILLSLSSNDSYLI